METDFSCEVLQLFLVIWILKQLFDLGNTIEQDGVASEKAFTSTKVDQQQ